MDISDDKPNKPNNNLAWSLVTLLACCMPLGIVSLVYSMKVDTLYFQGQHKEAQEMIDQLKLLNSRVKELEDKLVQKDNLLVDINNGIKNK